VIVGWYERPASRRRDGGLVGQCKPIRQKIIKRWLRLVLSAPKLPSYETERSWPRAIPRNSGIGTRDGSVRQRHSTSAHDSSEALQPNSLRKANLAAICLNQHGCRPRAQTDVLKQCVDVDGRRLLSYAQRSVRRYNCECPLLLFGRLIRRPVGVGDRPHGVHTIRICRGAKKRLIGVGGQAAPSVRRRRWQKGVRIRRRRGKMTRQLSPTQISGASPGCCTTPPRTAVHPLPGIGTEGLRRAVGQTQAVVGSAISAPSSTLF